MRHLLATIRNLIVRAHVSRTGNGELQATWLGRRTSPAEHLEPQGVHFIPATGAGGALLAPSGDPSVAFGVCFSGAKPTDAAGEGAGGLHLLGTYKVYLASDGTVHLGEKDPGDFVALASLVDARFAQLVTAFNAHVHTGVLSGGASSGAPGTPLTDFDPVGSENVKCS